MVHEPLAGTPVVGPVYVDGQALALPPFGRAEPVSSEGQAIHGLKAHGVPKAFSIGEHV
jgi:hypothetical protein